MGNMLHLGLCLSKVLRCPAKRSPLKNQLERISYLGTIYSKIRQNSKFSGIRGLKNYLNLSAILLYPRRPNSSSLQNDTNVDRTWLLLL